MRARSSALPVQGVPLGETVVLLYQRDLALPLVTVTRRVARLARLARVASSSPHSARTAHTAGRGTERRRQRRTHRRARSVGPADPSMKSTTPGPPSVDARRRRVRQRPGERRRERVRPTRAARDEATRASEATAQPRPRRDPPHELRLGLIERSPLHVRARLHVRHLEALVLRVGIEERRNRTRVVAVVVRAAGVPIGQLRVRRLRGHPLGDGAKIGKSPNPAPAPRKPRRSRPIYPAELCDRKPLSVRLRQKKWTSDLAKGRK